MDSRETKDSSEQIEELKRSIESLISDVQSVRLANDLSKLTQVRLVDLQYSAKLALENLHGKSRTEEDSKELNNA